MDVTSSSPARTPSETGSHPPHQKENIKETIESILVAFILAFVFRAFVVEAFVIPSGSMAPTLLGGHMRFRCEDCGYQFDVNYSDNRDESLNIPSVSGPRVADVEERQVGMDGRIVRERVRRLVPTAFSMHCPNCGFKVRADNPDPGQSAENSPVHYGDRILVLKYLYLLQEPSRWDVVVFKSPTEPHRHDYGQNFIKRLVGKPGEMIMLLDGDVYASPTSYAGPEEQRPWQVQTKSRVAQNALWRIVNDNDFYPTNSHGDRLKQPWKMPWQQAGGSGWNLPAPGGEPERFIPFDNMSGAGTLAFNKDVNKGVAPAWLALADWLPYNETKDAIPQGTEHYKYDPYVDERIPRWYVSDLKLQFCYDRKAGDGIFSASLTKLDHTFSAELLPGRARIVHRFPTGEQVTIGEADISANAGAPLQIEFTNVDYVVTLRINGHIAIQTTPQQYAPDLPDLLARHRRRKQLAESAAAPEQIRAVFGPPQIQISAQQQKGELSHLSLWRDVYYTPTYNNYVSPITQGSPERPVVLHRRGQMDPDMKILYEDEYFVLGDNSILSGDARAWTDPINLEEAENLVADQGRVPERFLLGKAFFVYWPAGYRPFSPTMPGVVPNFGELRFIH